jgi:hypothetical protein
MTPREIIATAWAITQREHSLRAWGFLSAFLQLLLTVKLLGYQVYFFYSYVSGVEVGLFDDFEWLWEKTNPTVFFTVVIGFILLLIIEFLVPHMATGAIIGLTAKSYRKEEVRGGLVLALYNFFPLFAIHEILFFAGWATVLSFISLTLRYIDGDIKFLIVGVLVTFWIISNILKFFFSFAPPAVVIRRMGIFEAMGHSFKLLLSYIGQIAFLLLLLLIISVRILMNAVIVILIPAIVVGMALALTSVISLAVSYTIAGITGVALIGVASYFFCYIDVFKEAVWTVAYIELKKNKDLDHIE